MEHLLAFLKDSEVEPLNISESQQQRVFATLENLIRLLHEGQDAPSGKHDQYDDRIANADMRWELASLKMCDPRTNLKIEARCRQCGTISSRKLPWAHVLVTTNLLSKSIKVTHVDHDETSGKKLLG